MTKSATASPRPGTGSPTPTPTRPTPAAGNTALLTQISLGTGGTKTYTHGPAGHLTEVNAAGNQILFESDAEGRLSALERPLAGARTEMLYDGRSFLAEAVEPHIFSDGFESGNLACWSSVVGGTKTGTCPTPPQEAAARSHRPTAPKGCFMRGLRRGCRSWCSTSPAGRWRCFL
jgi:hypothetical protein